MLANSMIYSRFRYFSSSLVMPATIAKALESDVDALLWDKHPDFNEGELGTVSKGRPMVKKQASTLALRACSWLAQSSLLMPPSLNLR